MGTSFLTGFEVDRETVLWRCIPRRRFLEMCDERAIYFASAREFSDPWEGARSALRASFRASDVLDPYAQRAFEELCRLTKINCWQMARTETRAMWSRYARNDDSVAIRSTVGRLTQALGDFRLKPEYGVEDVHVGAVHYIDFDADMMRSSSMIGRFFHKDRSFSYEAEFRAALSVRLAEEYGVDVPEKGVKVPVDLRGLVDSISVSPLVTDATLEDVQAHARRSGLRCDVQRSGLMRSYA